MGTTDDDWERYGAESPYYGVLTHEKFLGTDLPVDARREFFESGERHVADVLATLLTLVPAFAGHRALDFGCGAGRLSIPLADRFQEVVGLDVSESMLVEARSNSQICETDITFALSDDALSNAHGAFDLIHSFIVFQHIPTERGMRILVGLLERLAPGGVAVLHFTTKHDASVWRRALLRARTTMPVVNSGLNIMRRRPRGLPPMQMNTYLVARLIELVGSAGCELIHTEPTRHGDFDGVILFAQRVAPTA